MFEQTTQKGFVSEKLSRMGELDFMLSTNEKLKSCLAWESMSLFSKYKHDN